jgi:hypothetical protein
MSLELSYSRLTSHDSRLTTHNSNMKSYFLGILLIFCASSFGQQTGRMETDRPDQTESPFIVKHKFFQTEIGFNLVKIDGYTTIVVPTILWKYGLCKRLELRLITEINSVETPLIIPGGNETNTGLLPVQVGGKIGLWEEKGLLPKTGFLFHVAIPGLAGKKFISSMWAPGFRLSMQHSLSEKIGLGYNVGAEWDGESKIPFWVYTMSLGFNIGERWYSYIEIFGNVREKDLPQHNLDAGIGYYINDNIKLDLSSGFDITKNADEHYCALGISFRFR